MKRKPYDPIAAITSIASPAAIREKLAETNELARKLTILLDVAERLADPTATATTSKAAAAGLAVAGA